MTTSVLSRRETRHSALGVAGFAVALALASQVAIPIAGTPVPLTLQPMLVVLAGLWLGPRAAAASMILYLTVGALGAPVFTPMGAPGIARLLGPTGGYLLAYPLAAAVAGLARTRGPSYAIRAAFALAGMVVLHAGGLAQLTLLTGSVSRAVVLGLVPFAAADVVKALVAPLLAPRPPHLPTD